MTRSRVLCAGLTTLDLIQRVERLPGPNEKVAALGADLATGGPAAGAALAAAALGSPTTLLSALGRHALAGAARDELAATGVHVVDAAAGADTLPPISAVAVRDATGERSVVSRNGGDLTPRTGDLLGDVEADVVLVDGHYPQLAQTAAAYARERGVPLVLDAGSWKPVFDEVLGEVDLAVCSADFRVPGTGAPADQGPALISRGVGAVAVTRGADDVLWWRAGGDREAARVPVPRVTPVDTLGAGDVFHGALVAAMPGQRWREQLGDVLAHAAGVAASRVECSGRQQWLRSLREATG